MRKRRSLLAALVILLIVFSVACKKKEMAEPVGVLSTETLYEGNVNLRVYAVQEDQYMMELFDRFQYDMFKTKAAGITITWFDTMESLVQTVTTEMMGGGGPDVLFFYPDTFESSYNLMKNNVFADLNPIIEETEYNLSNLNSYVMEAGVYNGKRLIMPINYSVDMFIAADAFQEVSFDDLTSMEDFMAAHAEYTASKSGEENCFNFIRSFTLPAFLDMCNFDVVDFTTKKLVFEDSELKTYIDWYVELQQYFVKDEAALEGYSDPNYGPILEGDMVFMNDWQISSPNSVKYTLSLYKALSGEEEGQFYSFSDLTSDTSTAYVGLCGAVNKNSKSQTEAFELIKCALSKSLQENRRNFNIPVRNSVLDFRMLDLGNKATYNFDYEGTTVNIVPMTETEETMFRRFIKEPGNVIVTDRRYQTIMNEVFADYVNGDANWEDTLDQAKHRLKVYINE